MHDTETHTGPSNHAGHCASCGAALAHDQRYCLSCGTRRGPLPATVDSALRELRAPELPSALVPVPVGSADAVEDGGEDAPPSSPGWLPAISLPTPRVASLAVMGMLSFGVVAGSLSGPGGIDALARTLVVSVAPPPAPTTGPVTDSGAGGGGGGGAAAPATQRTITITSPAPAPPTAAAAVPAPAGSGAGTGGGGGGSGSAAVSLPPIKHVFEIVLSGQGYNQAFGTTQGHPYLARTLRRQGELLPAYYGVAPSPLANEIALLSGQGPTNQTAADCPQYTPVTPGTVGTHGQVTGDGCVYPKSTPTLPGELVANGYSWKAYLQGSSKAPAGQPATCRHPAPGATDANGTPRTGDPYVTWRNPLVYFDSIASSPLCATHDVDLSKLAKDLRRVSTTPNVSYIAADPCDDGSAQACAPGAPAGLTAADSFLKTVVPAIERSPAYRADGMIVITFDQAPQTGANADTSSCCDQPVFPNLTGAPSVASQTTSTSSTTPTTTGTTSTTTTPATAPTSATTTDTSTTTTGTSATPTTTTGTSATPTTTTGTSATPTTTTGTTTTGTTTSATTPCPPPTSTTPTTTTSATTTTGTTTSATTTTGTTTTGTTTTGTTTTGTTTTGTTTTGSCSSTGTPAGGGQVGALLISRYVLAGSSDVAGQFNHFSLLKTIEDLFSIKHLGYTTDAALPEFDSSTFNAPSTH